MIATDGVMREVHDVPRGNPSWIKDNPCSAVADFLLENQDFKLEIPEWKFNESTLSQSCTHFPDAFLRRVI
jgi:hypothetical protein